MSKFLDAVKASRLREKQAVAIAKSKFQDFLARETEDAHAEVVSAVRLAVLNGVSARQIGIAYGSTDPYTIRRLIAEATVNNELADTKSHPDWLLTPLGGDRFRLEVFSIGDTGLSGSAVCVLDEDGENFTVLEGDLWIQVQMYRLGYHRQVVLECKEKM
jgi:hypothetical protein